MFGSMVTIVLLASLGQKADEFTFDFRNAKFDERLFHYGRAEIEPFFKPEPAGLRIDAPAGITGGQLVALMVQMPLSGDFEATLGYEILSGQPNKGSPYPGLQLWVNFNSPLTDSLTFARELRADGDCYSVIHIADDEAPTKDGKPKRKTKNYRNAPASKDTRNGKLSIGRVGSDYVAKFAEGNGPLQELGRFAIGEGNVRNFRLAADTGPKTAIEVRLLDLAVKSPGSGAAVAALTAPRAAPGERSYWLVVVIVLFVLGLGGMLAVRHMRSKPGKA
jgi:hypothetical protein